MSRALLGSSRYALLIVAIPLLLTGCQSTALSKLAFWQKDTPILSARHDDYIEPPASQLSPTKPRIADSSSASGLPPTQPPTLDRAASEPRKPYGLSGDGGPDSLQAATQKLLDLAKNPARYSVGEVAKSNGLDLAAEANQMVNAVKANEIQLDPNNTPSLDVDQGGGRFEPSNQIVRDSLPKIEKISPPKRTENPYARANNQFARQDGASDGFNSGNKSFEQQASMTYPTTPYSEFSPKNSGAARQETPPITSAYQNGTLAPKRLNPSRLDSTNPIGTSDSRPLVPSPLVAYTNNPANQSGTPPLARTAELPAGLLNSKGSYSPGSTGKSRPFSGNLSNPAQNTQSTAPTSMPPSQQPNSSGPVPTGANLKLDSGGSFKFN